MSDTRRIHYSDLKHFAQSARHYRHNLKQSREANRAMLVGTAVHYKVLGGRPYQVWGGKRLGNEWKEFAQQYHGTDILSAGEEFDAVAIAAEVLADPIVATSLHGAAKEREVKWSWMGRDMSSTPDFAGEKWGELKVCRTAHPDKFWAHARDQLWFAQLALYQMALQRTDAPLIIAVEQKAPHVVTVFEVDERDLEDGRRMCRTWMEQLIACEESNHWPGYVQSATPVKLRRPEWADRGVVMVDDDDEGDE